MSRKDEVKTKILLRVFMGLLINYGWFLLFGPGVFDVGTVITVGTCSYVVYDGLSNDQ